MAVVGTLAGARCAEIFSLPSRISDPYIAQRMSSLGACLLLVAEGVWCRLQAARIGCAVTWCCHMSHGKQMVHPLLHDGHHTSGYAKQWAAMWAAGGAATASAALLRQVAKGQTSEARRTPAGQACKRQAPERQSPAKVSGDEWM
jgi:hypothetical protein